MQQAERTAEATVAYVRVVGPDALARITFNKALIRRLAIESDINLEAVVFRLEELSELARKAELELLFTMSRLLMRRIKALASEQATSTNVRTLLLALDTI